MSSETPRNIESTEKTTPFIEKKIPAPESTVNVSEKSFKRPETPGGSSPQPAANVSRKPSKNPEETKIDSTSPPIDYRIQIASNSQATTPGEDKEQFDAMWDLVIALEGLGFGNPGQVRERPKFTSTECMADGYALKAEFDKALNSSKGAIDAIIVSLRSEGVSQRGRGVAKAVGELPKGERGILEPEKSRNHASSYWTCCNCSAANDADGETTCSGCNHEFCCNCSLS